MRQIGTANATVTLLQLMIVDGVYMFFGAGEHGLSLSLSAAITAGIIAMVNAYGTWKDPGVASTHARIGFAALAATAAALGVWFWGQGQVLLAASSLIGACGVAALFARQAKKHWAKESFTELFAVALPNIGVLFGIVLGFFNILTAVVREGPEEY